ncbi:MAG: Trp biosynthesis-associated membrane protein [Actinomycetes bacterium]
MLATTVVLLLAAAAALGGAAAAGWARLVFQVPLRGRVVVRVAGSDLLPALGPLALLAVAAVAAALATGGWGRRLLGVLLLGAALVPALGVARVTQDRGLLVAAAGQLPARSVPDGMVTSLLWGPALAVVGAVLLAGAGVALLGRGHRMPRMGRRYRARRVPEPTTSGPTMVLPTTHHELWERIDAGEDPTVLGDPR